MPKARSPSQSERATLARFASKSLTGARSAAQLAVDGAGRQQTGSPLRRAVAVGLAVALGENGRGGVGDEGAGRNLVGAGRAVLVLEDCRAEREDLGGVVTEEVDRALPADVDLVAVCVSDHDHVVPLWIWLPSASATTITWFRSVRRPQ